MTKNKNDEQAERLWKEYIATLGRFVPDDLAARLKSCADEYGLDFEELFKWADRVLIGHGLLENLLEGTLDVVSMDNGEPSFRASKKGIERTEALLSRTPEGAALVKAAAAKRKREDKVLSARIISDS